MPASNKRPAGADASGQGSRKRRALDNISSGPAINGQFIISKPAIKDEKPSVTPGTTSCNNTLHNSKAQAPQPKLRSASLGAVTTISKLGNNNTHEPFESLSAIGQKDRRNALARIEKHFPKKLLSTEDFFRYQNQPHGLPKNPLDLCTPYLANFGDLYHHIGSNFDEVSVALRKTAKESTGGEDGTLAAEDIKEAEVQWRIKEKKAVAREAGRLDEQQKLERDRQTYKETFRGMQLRITNLEKEKNDLKEIVKGYELYGTPIKIEQGSV